MDINEYIKTSVPEFQQGDNTMTEFLDASGNFLAEAIEAIEHMDNSRGFLDSTVFNLENNISSRGLDLPPALTEQTKRVIVRDLAEIIRKNGTNDGLKNSLKLLGFNAEVRNAWIQSPIYFRKGFSKKIIDGSIYRQDITTKILYTDMLYGNEYVTEDGVFFEGYEYTDVGQTTKLDGVRILGETYKTNEINPNVVSKTPYVIVRFDEGEFNVSVSEYTDPETGDTFVYSTDEEFRLANNVIEYFLSKTFRPTTMRIIINVALHPLLDELVISEELTDTHSFTLDDGDIPGDSDFTVEEEAEAPGTVTIDSTIGNHMVIGMQNPYVSQFSLIPATDFGTYTGTVTEEYIWVGSVEQIVIPQDSQYPYIAIRPYIDITMQPTDVEYSVYGVSDLDGGIYDEVLIETVTVGNSFVHSTDETYHYIKIVQSVSSTAMLTIDLIFNTFNQNL
jgi:hypothetical protein